MYRDIQEPMMNAAQETIGNNPFAALAGSGGNSANTQQGRENTDPLPNPWGGGGATTDTSSSTTNTSSTGTGGAAGMQGKPPFFKI